MVYPLDTELDVLRSCHSDNADGKMLRTSSSSLPLPTGAATSAKQDSTEVLVGGVTETAPGTDTASSGLNGRLQRIAQRLTSLIGLLPTALTAIGSLKVGINETPRSLYAQRGELFTAVYPPASPGVTTEVPLLLFRNAVGSGKVLKLGQLKFLMVLSGDCTFRIYRAPTVTANGTAVTPVGHRNTGQNSAVVAVTHTPSISANGTLAGFLRCDTSKTDVAYNYDFGFLLDPNFDLLITSQNSTGGQVRSLAVEYAEQAA